MQFSFFLNETDGIENNLSWQVPKASADVVIKVDGYTK